MAAFCVGPASLGETLVLADDVSYRPLHPGGVSRGRSFTRNLNMLYFGHFPACLSERGDISEGGVRGQCGAIDGGECVGCVSFQFEWGFGAYIAGHK